MEKLTVEEVIQELIRDGWMGKDNFITLLKQIRDEIRGGDSYFMPKKMSDIDNVFDKYLNEK